MQLKTDSCSAIHAFVVLLFTMPYRLYSVTQKMVQLSQGEDEANKQSAR